MNPVISHSSVVRKNTVKTIVTRVFTSDMSRSFYDQPCSPAPRSKSPPAIIIPQVKKAKFTYQVKGPDQESGRHASNDHLPHRRQDSTDAFVKQNSDYLTGRRHGEWLHQQPKAFAEPKTFAKVINASGHELIGDDGRTFLVLIIGPVFRPPLTRLISYLTTLAMTQLHSSSDPTIKSLFPLIQHTFPHTRYGRR